MSAAVLTIADVERIAALAHLELTEEEKQLFTRQLADILAYAEQLQAVDTTGVPATAHVDAGLRAERDDEPRPVARGARTRCANAPDGAPDAGTVPRATGDRMSGPRADGTDAPRRHRRGPALGGRGRAATALDRMHGGQPGAQRLQP